GQLVPHAEIDALGLGAVAQGGIEDVDAFVLCGHAGVPTWLPPWRQRPDQRPGRLTRASRPGAMLCAEKCRRAKAQVSGKDTLPMADKSAGKLSLFSLTAMVIGSMVGAGIFNLPGRFATATGPFGAIIAWAIAGTGMFMLARVFQVLAEKRPDIDSGVFAYAKAGFGDYMGFLSAFGYWLGSVLGNVFYWVLIGSTLGRFFPG